ncbi:hypothetical protein [Herbiconiux sp.]|uniref:hypothetical protein n=1 Tax=Herbiconiux sp. TaxID=1871186 RepID=UPI0025C5DF50|nr:hypothetical protein [Herbiconiux sp.]
MASAARDALVLGATGLRDALNIPEVRAPDAAGAIIRRGLAVAAFNQLETFVEGRLVEIASFVNSGQSHYSDLPAKLQERASRNVVEVASAKVRRMDAADVQSYLAAAGASLAAVSGAINLSPLTWMWGGSNMGSPDYFRILKDFHVPSPAESARQLSIRFGYPGADPSGVPIRLDEQLKEFAGERHRAAHDAGYAVSGIWLTLAAELLVKFALVFDTFASVGAIALHRGERDFAQDPLWTTPTRISLRFVEEHQRGWAERREGGVRAVRVVPDRHDAIRDAADRCTTAEVLIVRNRLSDILEWQVPRLG